MQHLPWLNPLLCQIATAQSLAEVRNLVAAVMPTIDALPEPTKESVRSCIWSACIDRADRGFEFPATGQGKTPQGTTTEN